MDAREKLIDYIERNCVDDYGEIRAWLVADFILKHGAIKKVIKNWEVIPNER